MAGMAESNTQVYSSSNGVWSDENFDGICFFKRSVFADIRFNQIPRLSFEEAFKKAFGSDKALKECKKVLEDKKDKRYKKIQKFKKKHPDFTDEDALAIMAYTYDVGAGGGYESNPYRILNKTLGERKTGATEIMHYILYLFRALRKLDPITTEKPVYRTINGEFINKDTYKEGNILSWQAFTSTAKTKKVAIGFLAKKTGPSAIYC